MYMMEKRNHMKFFSTFWVNLLFWAMDKPGLCLLSDNKNCEWTVTDMGGDDVPEIYNFQSGLLLTPAVIETNELNLVSYRILYHNQFVALCLRRRKMNMTRKSFAIGKCHRNGKIKFELTDVDMSSLRCTNDLDDEQIKGTPETEGNKEVPNENTCKIIVSTTENLRIFDYEKRNEISASTESTCSPNFSQSFTYSITESEHAYVVCSQGKILPKFNKSVILINCVGSGVLQTDYQGVESKELVCIDYKTDICEWDVDKDLAKFPPIFLDRKSKEVLPIIHENEKRLIRAKKHVVIVCPGYATKPEKGTCDPYTRNLKIKNEAGKTERRVLGSFKCQNPRLVLKKEDVQLKNNLTKYNLLLTKKKTIRLSMGEIEYDENNLIPLFSKHIVKPFNPAKDNNRIRPTFHSMKIITNHQPHDSYSKYNQQRRLNIQHKYSNDYFTEALLIPAEDFENDVIRRIMHHYVNVVPHFETIEHGNKMIIEESIRRLAWSTNHSMKVFSGVKLSDRTPGHCSNIYLNPESAKFPVPESIFKLVVDQETRKYIIFQFSTKHSSTKPTNCKNGCGVAGLSSRMIDDTNQTYGYTCCFLSDENGVFKGRGIDLKSLKKSD